MNVYGQTYGGVYGGAYGDVVAPVSNAQLFAKLCEVLDELRKVPREGSGVYKRIHVNGAFLHERIEAPDAGPANQFNPPGN